MTLKLAQRISGESNGHSVGAVPFRSWLSCVRNLDKSKDKKLVLEQENANESKYKGIFIPGKANIKER